MELQTKHIAPYLPYGLKVCIMGENVEDKPIIFELVGLDTKCVEYHEIGRTVTEQIIFKDCFPILHPLSDMEKGAEIGFGNVGVYREFKILYFDTMYVDRDSYGSFDDCLEYFSKHQTIGMIPKIILDFMYQHHFDVDGLVPKGLAIDINTL